MNAHAVQATLWDTSALFFMAHVQVLSWGWNDRATLGHGHRCCIFSLTQLARILHAIFTPVEKTMLQEGEVRTEVFLSVCFFAGNMSGSLGA